MIFDYEKGSFAGITEEEIFRWQAAFPAVDVQQQIKSAELWLSDNPHKRKKNLHRFLTNWFRRRQEQGGDMPARNQKNRNVGKFCIWCGSSKRASDGKEGVIWREGRPFCSCYHYELWVKAARKSKYD